MSEPKLFEQGVSLSIDLCLGACVVALGPTDGPAEVVIVEVMARGHQERITPLVQQALTAGAVRIPDITRIGVTVGPGSFSGLRVGLAFARAFAVARGIACVGVSTLEGLGCEKTDQGLTLAAIRSRGEFYYVQMFRDGQAVMAPDVLSRTEIAARLLEVGCGESVTMIGPEVVELLDLAASATGVVRSHVDGATLHSRVCRSRAEGPPRPLYMRAPDARTLAERLANG